MFLRISSINFRQLNLYFYEKITHLACFVGLDRIGLGTERSASGCQPAQVGGRRHPRFLCRACHDRRGRVGKSGCRYHRLERKLLGQPHHQRLVEHRFSWYQQHRSTGYGRRLGISWFCYNSSGQPRFSGRLSRVNHCYSVFHPCQRFYDF